MVRDEASGTQRKIVAWSRMEKGEQCLSLISVAVMEHPPPKQPKEEGSVLSKISTLQPITFRKSQQ